MDLSCSLDAIQIDRWAPNVSQPHHDYWNPIEDTAPQIKRIPLGKFKTVHAGKHLSSWLERTWSPIVSFVGRNSESTEIDAKSATIFELENHEEYFKDAIQHEQDQKWIKEALKKHRAVYMITGYLTADEARLERIRIQREGRTEMLSYTAPGTQVVAVQYQKIHTGFLPASKITLESKVCWSYIGRMGKGEDLKSAIDAQLTCKET